MLRVTQCGVGVAVSLLGVAVVHELSLGYAMISVTSGEWECMTLSLKEPVDPTNYLQ